MNRPLSLAIFVLAAFLFFFRIGHHSFWGDELQTAGLAAQLSQSELWNSTDPTSMDEIFAWGFLVPYYSIIKIWVSVFGSSESGFRSLSATSALVGLAMILGLGERVWNLSRRTTLIAAALYALSPMMLWYAQEARYYALLQPITLTLCTFYLLYGRTQRRRWLVAWTITSMFALMTHPFMIFIIAALSLYGLWRCRKGLFGSTRAFMIGHGVTAAGFVLMLRPLLASNARININEPYSLRTDELMPWKILSNFLCGVWEHPSGLLALLLVITTTTFLVLHVRALTIHHSEPASKEAFLWVAATLGACFLMIFVSMFRPIMVEGKKYEMIFFAPFCVCLATALSAASWRLLLPLFLGIMSLNTLMVDWGYYIDPQKQNWRLAGKLIHENAQPGDVWLHHSPRRSFAAEYYGGGTSRVTRDVVWKTADIQRPIPDTLLSVKRIWIVKTGSISDVYAERLKELGFQLVVDKSLPAGSAFMTRLWLLERPR